MSYQIAYTTQFHSLKNVLWKIDIYINDYVGRPVEIKLDGDEPCVIEWPETDKMDVVQSSTCTLRVSNESDRQMVQLMNNIDAGCMVWRDGKPYWAGHLDDSIYEEPYSFKTGYVTELTFSDFGLLNRRPFTLTGKHSVWDILLDILAPTGFGNGTVGYAYSLLNPSTHQPIQLYNLYINTDRFKKDSESFGEMTTKREVLEDVLRPFGLRIMQKNGLICIYDIEYLRDHQELQKEVVWKGTDATMRGSETFGWFEVAFEEDAKETLAEINLERFNYSVSDRVFAWYYDEDIEERSEGFYIDLYTVILPDGTRTKMFKTHSGLSSSDEVGIAWRVKATKRESPALIPTRILYNDYVRWPVASPYGDEAVASDIFKIESGYLPLVPERDKYQLRVNLDLLLSLLVNPAEGDEKWNVTTFTESVINTMNKYKKFWKERMLRAYVPVKLELVDENGNVLMHYRNTRNLNHYSHHPVNIGNGDWVEGSAVYSDMLLAYYNDGLETTPFEGWATNTQTMVAAEINGPKHLPSLYRKREQGEYVPMPPVAGILRLTVSNCIYSTPYPGYYPSETLLKWLNWQLYRNPKITIVKANRKDDGIDTDTVYEQDVVNEYAECFSETVKIGTWQRGIAPSARGLIFDSEGNVIEKFEKDGKTLTLAGHRRHSIEDQKMASLPVLSGTAELDFQFHAFLDHSTPGVFVVTGLRQNLHQDTEEVTMARIANVGLFDYEFEWSDPYCAEEEEPYKYTWSSPVCAQEPGPYKFAWGNGICVKQYIYTLEWEEMKTYD
ncbi:MAG: hypothetical protein K6A94_01780 [Bacteroidales bacterium]|nr:hypothetical protein [Bacteroidales bacterium]